MKKQEKAFRDFWKQSFLNVLYVGEDKTLIGILIACEAIAEKSFGYAEKRYARLYNCWRKELKK